MILLCLVLMSGGMVWLSMPSPAVPWLPLVALAPFAVALGRCRPVAGFFLGWLGGTLFWVFSAWWLVHGFRHFMGWPLPLALLASLAVFVFQGLPYGLLGLARGKWSDQTGREPSPLWCAAFLTLALYPFSLVLPNDFALSLHQTPLAIQVADLGGIHLVNLLLLWINWLIAGLVQSLRNQRLFLGHSLVLAILVSSLAVYGTYRIESLASADDQGRLLTAAVIQPGLSVRASGENRQPQALETLVFMVAQALEGSPDLVVWPETPGSAPQTCSSLREAGLPSLLAGSGTAIMAVFREYDYGSPLPAALPGRGDAASMTQKITAAHNTLWLVTQDHCAPAYRKSRLVPFGEYIPFSNQIPWLKKVFGNRLEYSPGPGAGVISLPTGIRIQPLICFESLFPDLARQGAGLGAIAFVNLSNEGGFRSPKAGRLSLGYSVFRTVEQRRPMIRTANSGYSAHISATGAVVQGTLVPWGTRSITQARLYCPKTTSPYSKTGDLWLWIPAAGIGLSFMMGICARRQFPV
ncbi:MAG: apolipoprotein N-acyltransferase [Proteobacteria bacterium]|nr:apolipoprotein N-acyltransferase [Pseudomonadota bacterium]